MHFKTLVTVDVPQLEPNPIVDEYIEKKINLIKEDLERTKKKNFIEEINLEQLNALRTEFSRCVMSLMYDKMEPYNEQTEDPKFLQFEDMTEELKEKYEECTDCIRLSDGRILPVNDWFFRGKFVIHEDGKVYQKNYGQLKLDKRSKKAKRMKAILNYPYKKLYKSFEEFAEKGMGYTYNEHFGGYGYTFNPEGFYDWCVIGGRWPRRFLVKEDCTEYSLGNCSLDDMDNGFNAQKGYRWVAAARKKDIQWQAMRDWEFEHAKKSFYMFEEAYKSGEIPEGHFWKICGNKLVELGHILYIEDETMDTYLKRCHLFDSFKYPVSTYGFLDDNGYHEEEYVWRKSGTRKRINKQKRRNRIIWKRAVDNFIESIPDDTVIIGVDCHV